MASNPLPRPSRILMTVDTMGGVWTYAMELARSLSFHEVSIGLAVMGAPLTPFQRREVETLANVTIFESRYALEWMDDPWHDVDTAGKWLLEIAACFKPQLAHLNGYVHAALPWTIPVLVVAHSCVLSWWQSVKGEPAPARYNEYKERVRTGLEAANLVIAPTASMLAFTASLYALRTPSLVIPNSRDSTQFSPGEKQPAVFSSGRWWDEAKNIKLLYAIAPYVKWRISVAGATSADSFNPHQLVDELGRISCKAVAARLASASIYAAPALYEPFGLAILEAGLSGCALVLGDLPSLRENWEGAALFLPPRDEAAWCSGLNMLAADRDARSRLGRRALERGRELSPERMVGSYLTAYKELIDMNLASN